MHTFGSYVKEIQMTCCSQNYGGSTELKRLFKAARRTIQHRLDQAKKIDASWKAHPQEFLDMIAWEYAKTAQTLMSDYEDYLTLMRVNINEYGNFIEKPVEPVPTGFDAINIDPNCNADFDIVPDVYTNSECVSNSN
jgi:hypothetical protein